MLSVGESSAIQIVDQRTRSLIAALSKIAAAKTFIDFMANDEKQAVESVKASNFWPVKDLGDIYEGDALMSEYAKFIPCSITEHIHFVSACY